MNDKAGIMTPFKMVEIAKVVLERSAAAGITPETSKQVRLINDLTYWLEDQAMKFALAEKLIRIHYREEKGVLPADYEAWRKIRDGDDYKPKIHLV